MKIFLYVALYLITGFLFLVFCNIVAELDDDDPGCMLSLFWPVWLVIILFSALGFLASELAKRLRR